MLNHEGIVRICSHFINTLNSDIWNLKENIHLYKHMTKQKIATQLITHFKYLDYNLNGVNANHETKLVAKCTDYT